MNMPPVRLAIVCDEDDRAVVSLGLFNHLLPNNEVAVFVAPVATFLGVLESGRNLLCVPLLAILAYRGESLLRRLRANTAGKQFADMLKAHREFLGGMFGLRFLHA